MKTILALYPNNRGLGYACIEAPNTLIDYGIMTVRPIVNHVIMKRVKKFIALLKPTVVLVREANTDTTYRGQRMGELIDEIAKYASDQNIPVFRYARDQIKYVFEQCGASTKYEISKAILKEFPELTFRAPKPRKIWMDEDYNMGIFDALALITTYKYLNE